MHRTTNIKLCVIQYEIFIDCIPHRQAYLNSDSALSRYFFSNIKKRLLSSTADCYKGTENSLFKSLFFLILDMIYASLLSAVTSPLPVQSNAIGLFNTWNTDNELTQRVTFAQPCIPKKLLCVSWSLQLVVYISVPLCDKYCLFFL